ncbi:RAD52 family DNA repair protein [Embleya sp. NBC_00888]|uniref:Rad52/Rad22 family DNA repair protein n=1 Tax=Embleya sp. NBC_00888 TaxID=2975960 RepID=UPI00386C3AE9|nr:RAD52 family DNA repair protein [Embleya sp. NBC_00888]
MLTDAQIAQLFQPLPKTRVLFKQNQAHLAAWDVRRTLTRVFGFTGWSYDVVSADLVTEIQNGTRWTVVYRAVGRLTIRDPHGEVVGWWEDGATGEGPNQNSAAAAHDLAYKSAISVALKRCAANLGDQFGLSLYNKGSMAPVVGLSLAYLAEAEPAAQPDDPQVADDTDPDVAPAPVEDAVRQPERTQHAEPGQWGTPSPQPAAALSASSAEQLAEMVVEAQLAWTTRDALNALLGAAGRAGLAGAKVDTKDGPQSFGAMLAARVRTLDVAAAQLDQANATAEAAEEEPPPGDVQARDYLPILLEAIRSGWNDRVSLAACRQTATDQGLLERAVETRDGTSIPLHRMIDGRLGDLAGARPQPVQETAADGGDQVPPPGEWGTPQDERRASPAQCTAIATILGALGVAGDRPRRLAIVTGILGRAATPVPTMKDLTMPEAGSVIEALSALQRRPEPEWEPTLDRYANTAAATSQAA